MKKIKITIHYTGKVHKNTGDYILQQIPGISIHARNITNRIHIFDIVTLNERLVNTRVAYIENTNRLVDKIFVQ